MVFSALKDRISRKLHGTDLGKVSGIANIVAEAAGNVVANIDPAETIRITQITNAVHDEIFDYPLPSDFKDIIDLRPQVRRVVGDNFKKFLSEEFDLRKSLANNQIAIRNNNGTKSIRIDKTIAPAPITIHTVDDISDNGIWAVVLDGTNLTQDTVNFVSGSGSLNFDSTGAGTTVSIENSTMTQIDLEDHDEQSSLFTFVFLPDASTITNVILRWGNDTSNFWSRTVTSRFDGTSFVDGWNLVSFAWNGATETGTVDPAVIDYLRVTITYNGTADTDYRLDKVISSLGKIYELEYYSKFLFRSATGTFLETPTNDTDEINLDVDGNNILVYESARLIAQHLAGEDSRFDTRFFDIELFGDGSPRKPGLYHLYRTRYPSERFKPMSIYYRKR